MMNLSNKQYGYFIKGRYYKNPSLTASQLAVYGLQPEFYRGRLAPASHKRGFTVTAQREADILQLYNSLFKVNATTL